MFLYVRFLQHLLLQFLVQGCLAVVDECSETLCEARDSKELLKSSSLIQKGSSLIQMKRLHRATSKGKIARPASHGREGGNSTATKKAKSRLQELSTFEDPVPPKNLSYLHEIVGRDGVLMLSVGKEKPLRFNFAAEQLSKVGIFPTLFKAMDAKSPPKALNAACHLNTSGSCESLVYNRSNINRSGILEGQLTAGIGCRTSIEQAIAGSHQHALQVALERNQSWTAIFEDDAVPVSGHLPWDAQFRLAWAKLPAAARYVRLNWCFDRGRKPVGARPSVDGTFEWVRTEVAGGCTSAYMVHKSIIPQILSIFPCCVAVDACLAAGFFGKRDPKAPPGTPRSNTLLFNLDVYGSDDYFLANAREDQTIQGRGVLMQARAKLHSTRWMQRARH